MKIVTSKFPFNRGICMLLAVFGIVQIAHATPTYSVTTLGAGTYITGMNDLGQAVGDIGSSAFLYSGGVTTDLVAPVAGTTSVIATGINLSGQIAVTATLSNGEDAGYLYSHGVITNIGALPTNEGAPFTVTGGINNAGQIVGTSEGMYPNQDAFLYSAGVMNNLGTLAGGWAQARSINNLGQVTGSATNAAHVSEGFIDSNGVMTALAVTPDDINDNGQIVGSNGQTAVLYANGVTTNLGTLGGTISSAIAINNSGDIVGQSTIAPGSFQWTGFLYSGGVMENLNSMINQAGWTISDAVAINASGQIAAQACNSLTGYCGGVILNQAAAVPEPAELSLVALGLLALGLARGRKSNGALRAR